MIAQIRPGDAVRLSGPSGWVGRQVVVWYVYPSGSVCTKSAGQLVTFLAADVFTVTHPGQPEHLADYVGSCPVCDQRAEADRARAAHDEAARWFESDPDEDDQ